jgi:hypothetical protein
MNDIELAIIEMADKLTDRFHGVVDALKYTESKIDSCIDAGFQYKFDKTLDDESIRFWVLVHNELIERSNLEL